MIQTKSDRGKPKRRSRFIAGLKIGTWTRASHIRSKNANKSSTETYVYSLRWQGGNADNILPRSSSRCAHGIRPLHRFEFKETNNKIEQHFWLDSTHTLYSGNSMFWSWPQNRPLCLRYLVVYDNTSRNIPGKYLPPFRPRPFPSTSFRMCIVLPFEVTQRQILTAKLRT